MNFEKIFRHGDVILFKLRENEGISEPQKPVQQIILAWGEVTGHAHRLQGDLLMLDQENSEEEFLFRVRQKARLSHEEHETIVLEPGLYLKVNQVEYDPFQDLIVKIRD
ncbi:MAG: hypothetical protein AAFU64_06560 [Bacteroidota bacterium]